jgi:hypothetical protein
MGFPSLPPDGFPRLGLPADAGRDTLIFANKTGTGQIGFAATRETRVKVFCLPNPPLAPPRGGTAFVWFTCVSLDLSIAVRRRAGTDAPYLVRIG